MDGAWRATGCENCEGGGIDRVLGLELGEGENGVSAPGLGTHEEVTWGCLMNPVLYRLSETPMGHVRSGPQSTAGRRR